MPYEAGEAYQIEVSATKYPYDFAIRYCIGVCAGSPRFLNDKIFMVC